MDTQLFKAGRCSCKISAMSVLAQEELMSYTTNWLDSLSCQTSPKETSISNHLLVFFYISRWAVPVSRQSSGHRSAICTQKYVRGCPLCNNQKIYARYFYLLNYYIIYIIIILYYLFIKLLYYHPSRCKVACRYMDCIYMTCK